MKTVLSICFKREGYVGKPYYLCISNTRAMLSRTKFWCGWAMQEKECRRFCTFASSKLVVPLVGNNRVNSRQFLGLNEHILKPNVNGVSGYDKKQKIATEVQRTSQQCKLPLASSITLVLLRTCQIQASDLGKQGVYARALELILLSLFLFVKVSRFNRKAVLVAAIEPIRCSCSFRVPRVRCIGHLGIISHRKTRVVRIREPQVDFFLGNATIVKIVG